MNNIAKGNRAYQMGEWRESLDCYAEAHKAYPELCHIVSPLLDRAILQLVRSEKKRASQDCRVDHLATKKGRRILFSMVRDEIDILDYWLQHVTSLFDEIHVIDHCSIDGTREKLITFANCYPSLRVYFYDQPEYYQSELINYLVSNFGGPYDIDDWCFFLDADEFLVFSSQNALSALLGSGQTIIRFPWRNLVPLFDQPNLQPFERALLQSPRKENLSKIAFAPYRYSGQRILVDQGAHNLMQESSPIDVQQCPTEFWLAHYPIRSSKQFSRKLDNGLKAYAAISRDKIDDQGWHWGRYSREVGRVAWDVLQHHAYYYAEINAPADVKEVDFFIKAGATTFHKDFICLDSRRQTMISVQLSNRSVNQLVQSQPKGLLTVSLKANNDLLITMIEIK